MTLQLEKDLATGRDAASCLRSFIKSMLGVRSNKLPRYGMRPRCSGYSVSKPAIGFEA